MEPAVHRVRWRLIACALAGGGMVLAAASSRPWTDRDAAIAARVEAVAGGVADASGRTYPLLIHHEAERWFQPLAVYPAALLRRIGIPAETAVRLPSLVAAGASVALTLVLASVIGRERRPAAVAAVLMVLSPALLSSGRGPGGELMIVPLVLAWCLSVLTYLERPRPWLPAVGGLALGGCLWIAEAGVLAVPVFLVIGCTLLIARRGDLRACVTAGLGVSVTLAILAMWFWRYPETYADTFGRWAIHAAHVRNPWDGLIAFTRWDVLGRRAAAYWNYVSPTFLFDGRQVFGVGMAVLVPVGLWSQARDVRAQAWATAVIGFFAAPIAAVLLDEPRSAHLALLFVPFGALLGARGTDTLLKHRLAAVRVTGLVLLLLLAAGALRTLVRSGS